MGRETESRVPVLPRASPPCLFVPILHPGPPAWEANFSTIWILRIKGPNVSGIAGRQELALEPLTRNEYPPTRRYLAPRQPRPSIIRATAAGG